MKTILDNHTLQPQGSHEFSPALRCSANPASPAVAHAPVTEQRPSFFAGKGDVGALVFAWTTAIGRRHAEGNGVNEDSVAVEQDEERLHAIVADGVSMGACGAIASAACANHLVALRLQYPLDECASQAGKAALEAGIRAANAVVVEAVARFGVEEGATTFSGLWFSPVGSGWVSRCGDCRVWLFWRNSVGKVSLHQLGEDQTFATTGETPYAAYVPYSNPSRMVGIGDEYVGEPNVWDITLSPDSGVMLTSDGVHGVLDVDRLRLILEEGFSRQASLAAIVGEIGAPAREGVGGDDASVFLLHKRW